MQKMAFVPILYGVLSFAVFVKVNGRGSSNVSTASSCAVQSDEIATLDCPAWFKPGAHNGSCQCGDDVFPHNIMIHCDNTTNVTKISTLFCATFDNSTGTVFGGRCLYNFIKDDENALYEPKVTLPRNVSELNEAMCGPLRRTGLLCSKCKEGLGPPVLSYKNKCLPCLNVAYGWLVYILAAFGPTTVFCILIIVCRIDVTSPALNLVVMICQTFVSTSHGAPTLYYNIKGRMGTFIIGVLTFYGFWNLDVLRAVIPPFCLSPNMNSLQVLALDYLVAVYPLVITAIIYYCIEYHDRGCRLLVVIWKPFHPYAVRLKRVLNLKGTIINVFATFFLLSYCKLLYISHSLLGRVPLFSGCKNHTGKSVIFREPAIHFFSKSHLPYAVLAIFVLTIFVLLPLVFILFYQNKIFQRCLTMCRLHTTLFTELARVCNRSYKNGIDGTPDCRWYAGVYFLFRCLSLLLSEYIFFYNKAYPGLPLIILCGFTTVLSAILCPYRKMCFNILDTVLLGIFTLGAAFSLYPTASRDSGFSSKFAFVVGCVPLLCFICFIAINIVNKIKSKSCFQALMQAIKKQLPVNNNCSQDQDVIPHRLEHSSEYQPLLSPAGSQDTY